METKLALRRAVRVDCLTYGVNYGYLSENIVRNISSRSEQAYYK